ncbi:MAG: amidohydrolase family protein [Clostridia bacterium]|nr:amidohydrolase family protein [Clostridia bacterium]
MIDAHAHISNTTYGNVEIYLEQLKQAGVDEGIVVPGGMLDVRRMTDYVIGRAQPDSVIPDNSYVRQSCNANDKTLKGFICIDPHSENANTVLENGYKEGYKGLKLSPMTHEFSFASKAVAELAASCGNYGFPVYSHVLYSPGASTVKFVELAKQFPRVNFILGHMGFGPADQDGLEAAVKLNNFFLETSTGNYLHIKECVKRAGASKVIFGSEFPLSHPKAELEKILLLDLPGSETDKILGDNIKGLLTVPDTKPTTPTKPSYARRSVYGNGRVNYR